ncbi:hypothetical protein ACWDAF_42030, partial [Streptomyces sp. NPDC001226]
MNEPQRCTREMLAKAAEHCSDIDEVIAYLGMHPSGQLPRLPAVRELAVRGRVRVVRGHVGDD